MRFQFCGDADCPDWVLAQLFHISKWIQPHFEIVCGSVREALLNGGQLNEAELFERLGLYNDAKDQRTPSTAPATPAQTKRLDIDDVRSCFGALSFILASAWKYRVGQRQLGNELEQLGLASEHSRVLCEHLHAQTSARVDS